MTEPIPFKLTPCQEAGLFRLSMTNDHVVIAGPAGTGKTFLLKTLLGTFPQSRIVYCAPTHAAKEVLQETLGGKVTAYTIHSILKIHPETYEDEMKFSQQTVPDMSEIDILVVDEGSMLDSDLISIMMQSIHLGCRVIVLGDPYQIQPVRNQPGIISPIFFDQRFVRVVLNEIVRQGKDSPIITVATKIRKEGVRIHACHNGDGEGVFNHPNISSLMQEYFKYVKTPEDTLKYKFLTYKNAEVNKLNGIIRQRIYHTTEPFVDDEYLILQEPVYRKMEHKDLEISELMFHNGQTVQIEPNSITRKVKTFDMKHSTLEPIDVNYFEMTIKDINTGDSRYQINVIENDSDLAEIEMYLHYLAINYKRMARTGTSKSALKPLWKEFWRAKAYFTDVKGAACCTYHKSQGSTFDGVFILATGMGNVDPRVVRQLEYVGVTRARKFVHFLI